MISYVMRKAVKFDMIFMCMGAYVIKVQLSLNLIIKHYAIKAYGVVDK
jgi:hypothetical protein